LIRSIVITTILVLLAIWPARAAMETCVFRVDPGGATVVIGGITVEADEQGFIRMSLDDSAPQSLTVRRPPFDDLPMVVTWDAPTRQWRITDGRNVGTYLMPGTTLALDRTMRLNVEPADSEVCVPASEAPGGATVDVDLAGAKTSVVPLPRRDDGAVRIPHAASPPPLVLMHAGYRARILRVSPEEMQAAPPVPARGVALEPQDGGTARWPLVVGGLVSAAAVALVVGLRKRGADLGPPRVTAEMQRVGPGMRLRTEGGLEFTLGERIGGGGMGVVYAAQSASPQTPKGEWAVKILSSASADEETRERFRREIAVCCRLTHPGIV
jgi:hypothetical protein